MNIFILPSKNKNNKYIDLLLNSLVSEGSDLVLHKLEKDTVWNVFKIVTFGKIKKTKNIVHIQWSTILYGSKYLLKSIISLLFNILLFIILKLFFNTKVVWTIHNFHAHDYSHPTMDRFGRKCLFTISDLIIVQQKITFKDFSNKYPDKKIQYLPHGNYIGEYGSQKEIDLTMRRSLGFGDNDIVLLSLGVIAPYKRNEDIINAVTEARKNSPEIKLLIIGKGKENYVNKLKDIAGLGDGIIIKNYFVPDLEIPTYFSVSNYSIFYYDDSEMTSGGIVLSLSYGLPVISRNIPGSEIVTGNSGYVFSNFNELISVLKRLPNKFENTSPDDIIDSVRQYEWNSIASELINKYKSI